MAQSVRVHNTEFMYLALCMAYAHSVILGEPDEETKALIQSVPPHVAERLIERIHIFTKVKETK